MQGSECATFLHVDSAAFHEAYALSLEELALKGYSAFINKGDGTILFHDAPPGQIVLPRHRVENPGHLPGSRGA